MVTANHCTITRLQVPVVINMLVESNKQVTMKQIILICLTLVSLFFNTALAADLSKLVILHTNDTHGYDEKAKEILGMAAVSALKQDY